MRLGELGKKLGYLVRVTPNFDAEGEPVRSTRIRSLLQDEGAVDEAAGLLGRPYAVWGEVIYGAQRGRSLGFPTANLALPDDRLVPAHGVYACWAWRGDAGHPAVVNIGVRPTFDNGHTRVEAFLLDFSGDLYGETVGLSFIKRLRGEQRFANIEELITQIGLDSDATRGILADPPTDAGEGIWEELEHTADWEIRVKGRLPARCLCQRGRRMCGYRMPTSRAGSLARTLETDGDGYSGSSSHG